jgi:hypothetical protein
VRAIAIGGGSLRSGGGGGELIVESSRAKMQDKKLFHGIKKFHSSYEALIGRTCFVGKNKRKMVVELWTAVWCLKEDGGGGGGGRQRGRVDDVACEVEERRSVGEHREKVDFRSRKCPANSRRRVAASFGSALKERE